MTKDETKSAAIMNFVDLMIGALESGFVEKNNPTLAEIHQVARNHIKDNYNVQYDPIDKRWGDEVAELCGLKKPRPADNALGDEREKPE
jgi:hypothetical protein